MWKEKWKIMNDTLYLTAIVTSGLVNFIQEKLFPISEPGGKIYSLFFHKPEKPERR